MGERDHDERLHFELQVQEHGIGNCPVKREDD